MSDARRRSVLHAGGVRPVVEDDGLGDREPGAAAVGDRTGRLSDRAADRYEPVVPVEAHVDPLRVPDLREAGVEVDVDGEVGGHRLREHAGEVEEQVGAVGLSARELDAATGVALEEDRVERERARQLAEVLG